MTANLSYSIITLLTLVCALTYAFEIIFGLAGTIMMLLIMSYFVDTKTLVVYSTLPQLMVAGIGLWRSPNTVEFRFLAGMLGFALLGSLVGIYLFYLIPLKLFEILLAIAITLFGAYLVSAQRRMRFGRLLRALLDFTAGLSQQLFGISGPIAMTRIMGSVDGKTAIRNYALAFFLSLNLLRLASYLWQSSFSARPALLSDSILLAMAVSAPVLLVTLLAANHLHFRVNENVFKKTVSWIILLGGLQLLYQAIYS